MIPPNFIPDSIVLWKWYRMLEKTDLEWPMTTHQDDRLIYALAERDEDEKKGRLN